MSGECRKIGDRQRWEHLPPGPHHTYNAADHPTTLRYPGGTAASRERAGDLRLQRPGPVELGERQRRVLRVQHHLQRHFDGRSVRRRGQLTEQRLDTGVNGLTPAVRLRLEHHAPDNPAGRGVQPDTRICRTCRTPTARYGNVASIVDGVNASQRQCFGYDALDRLTNAFTGNWLTPAYTTGGTGPYNHTYVYDAIGNLTSYAGASYYLRRQRPQARRDGRLRQHLATPTDANGNQTTRTIAGVTYTFTFDYENRLTEVKQGIHQPRNLRLRRRW